MSNDATWPGVCLVLSVQHFTVTVTEMAEKLVLLDGGGVSAAQVRASGTLCC